MQVNGQFRCFGSLQHLKSRFGKGIALYAKVAAGSDTGAIKNYISAHFTQLEFKGEHAVRHVCPSVIISPPQGAVHYVVYDRMTWARIFGVMEKAKREFQLQDYSVCQVGVSCVISVIHAHDRPASSRCSSSSPSCSSRTASKHAPHPTTTNHLCMRFRRKAPIGEFQAHPAHVLDHAPARAGHGNDVSCVSWMRQ